MPVKTSNIIFLLLISSFVFGQKNKDPKLNLNIKDKPVRELLLQIEEQTQLIFSFNTELINRDSIVTYFAENKSIEKVISELFFEDIKAKIIGNHIVLLENSKNRGNNKKIEPQIIHFSGNVICARNSLPISNANVYDISTRETVLTDSSGQFEIDIISNIYLRNYNIAKSGYRDTIISIDIRMQKQIEVKLMPLLVAIVKIEPKESNLLPVEQKSKFMMGVVPEEALITSENLHYISEKRIAQISFIPTVGTNMKSSGVIRNNVSVNVLAGYNGGVNGVEIGGLVNIIDRDVVGLQAAGLSNIVAGKTKGVQVAGLFNKTKESVRGGQIAGLINFNSNRLSGIQISGISNITKGKTDGAQISGIHNFSKENMNGTQVSGVLNQARKEMNGLQVSIVNYGKANNGLQLGLINVSDSSRGIAIGLFNYVKNGYRAVELSGNEIFYTNLKFKSGARHFYTIYSLGMRPNDVNFYGFGFGFGSNFDVFKKFSLSIDATSNYVHETENQEEVLNLTNRLDISIDYKITKNISFNFGPSYNLHISQLKDEETGQFTSDITTSPFYNQASGQNLIQMWIGGSIGFRCQF